MNYLKKFFLPKSQIGACALSALLIGFSFPFAMYSKPILPFVLSALFTWVAWIPLMHTSQAESPKRVWCLFYFTHFFSSIISLFWVIVAMKKYGNMSLFESSAVLLGLALLLAIFPAYAAYASAKLSSRVPRAFSLPVFLASVQSLLTVFPLEGFPWLNPSYALFPFDTLLQHLDFVGVYGYDLLIYFTNMFLLLGLSNQVSRKKCFLVVLFFLGAYLLGYAKQVHWQQEHKNAPKMRVSYVQGNISQDEKHSPEHREKILQKYTSLTKEVAQRTPDLIIWPEASLPAVLDHDIQRVDLALGIEQSQAYLLLGAPSVIKKNNSFSYINSAFLLSPQGDVLAKSDKVHLVPFGEYVPFSSILPMSKIVPSSAGDFSKGNMISPILIEKNHVSLGNLICYEILFSSLARSLVLQGANVLSTITNDAWFDETSGPYQHFHFVRFRALENRRSVVRSANTGFSGWVDPSGRIQNQSQLFQTQVDTFEVPIMNVKTLYVLFPWFLPFVSWIFLIACFVRRYSASKP